MKTCFKMTGRSKAGVSVSMHDFVPTPEEHCPPVIEILSVSRSTLLKNFGNKMATRNQKPRRKVLEATGIADTLIATSKGL